MPCFGCPGLSVWSSLWRHNIAISGDVADPSVVPRGYCSECEIFSYFIVYYVYQKTVYFCVHGIRFVVCDKLTNISKFSSFSCVTDFTGAHACRASRRPLIQMLPIPFVTYVQKLSQLLVLFLEVSASLCHIYVRCGSAALDPQSSYRSHVFRRNGGAVAAWQMRSPAPSPATRAHNAPLKHLFVKK